MPISGVFFFLLSSKEIFFHLFSSHNSVEAVVTSGFFIRWPLAGHGQLEISNNGVKERGIVKVG